MLKNKYWYLFYKQGGSTEYEISFAGSNREGTLFICSKIFYYQNRTVWFPGMRNEYRKK